MTRRMNIRSELVQTAERALCCTVTYIQIAKVFVVVHVAAHNEFVWNVKAGV